MATENQTPLPFTNPFLPWVEQGLRALDQTVTTTQNTGEAVDRVVRAEAEAIGPATAVQRNIFELMTEAWVQWMSWLGTMARLGTNVALPREMTRQVIGMAGRQVEAVSGAAREVAARATTATTRRAASGTRRERQPEHAAASDEPKRRRSSAKTKSRRGRQSRA